MKLPFFNNGGGIPSTEWLQNAQVPPCTPDLVQFERREYSLFFEYGDLQDKMPKHQMVSPYYSTSAYTTEKYGLIKQCIYDDTYPIAFNDHFRDRPIKRQKIKGELYAVKMPNAILVDSYRQNGVFFQRRR